MTISSTTTRTGPYSGNGSTLVFPYTFRVLAETDIEVTLTSALGVDAVKTLATHYAVSGVGASGGGNVTMVAAPAAGETLTLRRNVLVTQGVDLQNQGAFYAEDIETALDRLTMHDLQAAEVAKRSVKVPVAETTDMVLPAASLRANKAMVFGADGLPGVSLDNYVDQAAASAASASAASGSASAASGSASAASASATSASTSASNASTSATNSATSATAASTSASNAATSATSAASSATAADVAKIEWKGAWSGATAYAIRDAVVSGGTSYICTAAHTNQVPPNASYWDVLAAKGTDGAGTGDMLGANNLAQGAGGVASAATAFANIKQAATTTATGVVELATDAETATGTDATRALTPANLAAAGIKQGLHTIYIPAVGLLARTTNGAASGSVETTTNKVMLKTLDFDTATSEYAQFSVRMPKSWDEGTVTAAFTWSHPATTVNFGVAWGLQAVAMSDDDAADAAFGTALIAVDTGGTTNDIYVSPATAAITIAGTPVAEDWVVFQAYRAVADAGDTMAVDARLHGVTIYYTVNSSTDA